MRVTLLHNPAAGHGEPSAALLLEMIRAAGHEPVYRSTSRRSWRRALQDPGDLVAIAGGDGTAAEVARALGGRHVPFTILPLGMANDIATTFGLIGTPQQLIAQWATMSRHALDLGCIRGAGRGNGRFVEAAGLGLFTELVRRLTCDQRRTNDWIEHNRGLPGYVRMLLDQARRGEPRGYRVVVDGEELSGDYLLVEAMNVRFIGPTLRLAGDADPGDGRLDVVLVREEDRAALVAYLEAHLAAAGELPALPTRRAKRLELEWADGPLRVDDRVGPASGGRATLTVVPQALEVLAPGSAWDGNGSRRLQH